MVYYGHVRNGVIVLDGPTFPPEGAIVSVRVLKGRSSARPKAKPLSFYERYKDVIGKGKGLPSDLAKNHDHYLHGRPKK